MVWRARGCASTLTSGAVAMVWIGRVGRESEPAPLAVRELWGRPDTLHQLADKPDRHSTCMMRTKCAAPACTALERHQPCQLAEYARDHVEGAPRHRLVHHKLRVRQPAQQRREGRHQVAHDHCRPAAALRNQPHCNLIAWTTDSPHFVEHHAAAAGKLQQTRCYPAWSCAATPVRTKTPAPTIAPTPSRTRSIAPRHLRSPCPCRSGSAESCCVCSARRRTAACELPAVRAPGKAVLHLKARQESMSGKAAHRRARKVGLEAVEHGGLRRRPWGPRVLRQ